MAMGYLERPVSILEFLPPQAFNISLLAEQCPLSWVALVGEWLYQIKNLRLKNRAVEPRVSSVIVLMLSIIMRR
jgi:hypothetical protein